MEAQTPTDLAVVLHDLAWLLPRTIGREPDPGYALPASELEIMRLLVRRPGLSVNDTAAELRLAPANVSTALRALEARGLLERRRDPADGRVVRLHPTEAALTHRSDQERAWGGALAAGAGRAAEGRGEADARRDRIAPRARSGPRARGRAVIRAIRRPTLSIGPLRYGRVRSRVRAWIVLLTVTACTLVVPGRALAVGWGINMDGAVNPGNPPAFTYQSNPYFTELLGGSSCADGTSTAVCYARIYIPWDAVNDGKGSVSAGTCQKSPAGPGTLAAEFIDEVSAAARAVGVGHVLVALQSSLNTSTDDIWPTDSEYECGLSGLEQAAPGVTQWEIFNEPDSAYIPDSAPGGGPNCVHRNGVWVAAQDQCVFGSSSGHPIRWQRTRRQCSGGGVLVPRRQAGGSEQNVTRWSPAASTTTRRAVSPRSVTT